MDMLPDIEDPVLTVESIYPGASPDDVNETVTAFSHSNSPIENCNYVGDRLDTDALGSKMVGMT